MRIGVPKEIKTNENRVALVPAGAEALCAAGHEVYLETGAGIGSGFEDSDYREAGAQIVPDAASAWGKAELLLKVKEPIASEWGFLRPDLTLFTYLHFAADEALFKAHMKSGATCIAYETLEDSHGRLPILTPMSEVAGRMAVIEGAKYLERPFGGRGVLISGVPGVEPAKVVILGGGVVGLNAAQIAAGVGAQVTIFDVNADRLRYLHDVLPPNVTTLYSNPLMIRKKVLQADLVIGAVLVAGAKAPVLVTREDVARMKDGSVILDVAVDQGGCVETCRPTTHSDPIYIEEGVVHYCVANMPGAVARTSTFALTNATLPFLLILADSGIQGFAALGHPTVQGLNIHRGKIFHHGVAGAFQMELAPLSEVLN
jgi:alanine dehydrogenase